jgi:hypothetical protein
VSKRKFVARIKHWPHEDKKDGRRVYPAPGAKTSQVAEKDRMHFARNPQAQAFIRDYIPGEFDGVPLPEDIKLNEITHIQRINQYQQARIALTQEMANAYFARYGKQQ